MVFHPISSKPQAIRHHCLSNLHQKESCPLTSLAVQVSCTQTSLFMNLFFIYSSLMTLLSFYHIKKYFMFFSSLGFHRLTSVDSFLHVNIMSQFINVAQFRASLLLGEHIRVSIMSTKKQKTKNKGKKKKTPLHF
jgi:hypothetical protein